MPPSNTNNFSFRPSNLIRGIQRTSSMQTGHFFVDYARMYQELPPKKQDQEAQKDLVLRIENAENSAYIVVVVEKDTGKRLRESEVYSKEDAISAMLTFIGTYRVKDRKISVNMIAENMYQEYRRHATRQERGLIGRRGEDPIPEDSVSIDIDLSEDKVEDDTNSHSTNEALMNYLDRDFF